METKIYDKDVIFSKELVLKKLIEMISKYWKIDAEKILPETKFGDDLKIRSLDFFDFIADIDCEFSITIIYCDIVNIYKKDVQALADYIFEHKD